MQNAVTSKALLQARKIVVLAAGVTIMSFGGVFCVKSQLGLAPATVVPYTLSQVFPLSFGTFTALFNAALVWLQVLILRKDFRPWQLLQFLVAVLFGLTVDFATYCMRDLSVSTYPAKWLCSVTGAVLIAAGIALEVLSDSIPAPADSTVQTISAAMGRPFSTVKTAYDCVQVCLAMIISLAGLGKIVAVREGSLFLALFTGLFVKAAMNGLSFTKKYLS